MKSEVNQAKSEAQQLCIRSRAN